MSRKTVTTVCKSKQIPRIFQRRKPNVRVTGRTSWNLVENVCATNNANTNNRENASPTTILETNANDHRMLCDDRKNEFSTKNWNCQGVNGIGTLLTSVENENIDKITDGAETVADIEKWLKIKTQTLSTMDIDALKHDSVTDTETENVIVEGYLANDLHHGFLDKDSDGLSLDMVMSDKKLGLGYDPMLQELRSDKLLEACDKNEGFILADFQLDHLHPLILSPEDMMVAGEILPSAGDATVAKDNSSERVNLDDENRTIATTTESSSRLMESDIYELAEELEDMGGGANFDDVNAACSVHVIEADRTVESTLATPETGTEAQPADERRTRNGEQSRTTEKRACSSDEKSDNQITLRGEECNLEGRDGIMAVVAISTDNVSNMTQIVINAGDDEQIYQGKTSALIRATGNFPKLPKIDATINWNNVSDNGLEYAPSTQHELIISNALAELGITDECLRPMTNNEHGRTWLCPRDDCSREFNKIYALKGHLLAHYGVRPFKCDYEGCAWAFHSDFKLKRHKETHLKRKDFVCAIPDCNRRFTTVYNLWSHEKLHTRPNRVTCQVPNCQEKFQTKRALELHMKSHDQSHAPYVCQHLGCGKRYYSSNALTSHQRCHSYKEIDVKCSWPGCGKLFDKPCRLKAHLRSHTGCKPYSCDFQDCHWAFSSSSKLKRHEKKHTNERKFICEYEGCGKAFMRSEHLKEHSLTHREGTYFECHICDARFSAKSSLYVHIKKHQSNETAETTKSRMTKRRTNERRSMTEKILPRIINNDNSSSIDDNNRVDEKSFPRSTNGVTIGIVDGIPIDYSSYDCHLKIRDATCKWRTNDRARTIAMPIDAIEDGDKSSIGVDDRSYVSVMDYDYYETPRTTTRVAERMPIVEIGNAIVIDRNPETVACLPEPEPPPIDEQSFLSLDSYSTIENVTSFDERTTINDRGSARTNLTRDDVRKLKTKIVDGATSIVGASDVVLGTADLGDGLLLTEELPSMYYHDDMVGTECQILLLDPTNSENTITLRGLE